MVGAGFSLNLPERYSSAEVNIRVVARPGRPTKKLVNPPNRIREARLALGDQYTQEFVGDQIGVTAETVRKWEIGENEITLNRLEQLARVLKVTPCELLRDYDAAQSREESAILGLFRRLSPADRQLAIEHLALLERHHKSRAS